MNLSSIICLALCMLASNTVLANAELAKSKNCMACHAVASKVVGPAYKDIAGRYAGQSEAEDKLVQKIRKGGSGVWGAVPMPSNPQVSEAEARILAKWVLGLR